MPTYDMGCKPCDHIFEVRRRMSDQSPVACPKCGGETVRLYFNFPTTFTRKIDHPDSPLDDLPGAEKMRKAADMAIHKTLKDMGKI
jgi:putative FmdB family regulatory protein